jgi:acetyl esterase
MHGMLESMVKGTAKKRLNIERIAQIKRAAGIFLTLHGGSGTDDADFQQAIAAGINIIHINTELRVAWRQSLQRGLAADPNQVVPYRILQPVVESVKQVAADRLRLFNTPRKAVLESATQKFLDELKAVDAPPLSQVTLKEARATHARGQDVPVVKLPADIEDRTIGVGPNGKLLIRIVRPKGLVGPLPAVMYFHGGGFVLGDRHDWDRLLRDLAYAANASIVFVEYSRSPEARYPVAIEEAYAATRWVAENGDEINVDRTRLALAGDGSGGNMVAAVTLLAKRRGGPKLDLQVMFYPNTDTSFSSDSYKQFASGYYLSRQDMEWFLDQYLPDKTRRTEATVTPLNASIEQLTGHPPALLITAECDVLRDEGEAYARKLLEAGVTVTSTRYLGTIHGFVTLNRLAYTPAARTAIMQAGAALQNALEGGGTRVAA